MATRDRTVKDEEALRKSLARDKVKTLTVLRPGTQAWETLVPDAWKRKSKKAIWVDDDEAAVHERWYWLMNGWWAIDLDEFRERGAWAYKSGSSMSKVMSMGALVMLKNPATANEMLARQQAGLKRNPPKPKPPLVHQNWKVTATAPSALDEEVWIEQGTAEDVASRLKPLVASLSPGENVQVAPTDTPMPWEASQFCIEASRTDPKVVAKLTRTLARECEARHRLEALMKRRHDARSAARDRWALKDLRELLARWATKPRLPMQFREIRDVVVV